jgi:GDP/UDP-N,N'-diacetylbacillosamine 2-epimerase (hydrolysing)
MRKICVVTATRAEYGLLYPLIKKISKDEELILQLVVTGMHLSSEFGLTYKMIEKEFNINKKVEILLSSDTKVAISKSMGLAQISFAETFDELNPDMIVILGDRYEMLSVASCAMIANIPIIHIHGGETTEGAFDEAIRHSITKMSHLHFTSTDEYKSRVIQLGENPSTVFNVGALGVENIKEVELLTKEEFEESIEFKLNKKNLMITFHPVTLENATAGEQFQELLDAIDQLEDTNIIFTKANSDTNGRIINNMIDEYVLKNSIKSIAFHSLGMKRYLSGLQFMDGVVGNSSSGIIEAPSFNIATINIGDRQKGRVQSKSIINCLPKKDNILKNINKIYTKEYIDILNKSSNPYEKEGTSSTILAQIKSVCLDSLLKKSFFDIS